VLIAPNWLAPARVRAAMTTRAGGVSTGAYDSMNLGYSTADDRANVIENERRAAAALGVRSKDMHWVYQVHGNVVHRAEALPVNEPLGATTIEGDAIVSRTPGLVCGIKIADCMPVLFAADDASVVAGAHAGWRGLASGILENTIAACETKPEKLVAWLGPCIGPTMFEVGEDVRAAFVTSDANGASANAAFVAQTTPGKYLCDLPKLAQARLRRAGVERIYTSDLCTMSDAKQFFSHRRDRITGRMAAFVWIDLD
jgi:polyphenol oxidase